MIDNPKGLIDSFIKVEEQAVLGRFAGLPSARIGKDAAYVFIPGSRPPSQRALIVAHADTVWMGPSKSAAWKGAILTGGWHGGLGADDRVGCAAAWLVAQAGEHSVLITTEEECGAIGASMAAEQIPDVLRKHAFMLQVDRAGDEELVFYHGGHSREWAKWLGDNDFHGWQQGWGTFTDITVLAPALQLCAANLAAGYMHEHTQHEIFFLDAWQRTMERLERVLQRDSFPVFKPDAAVHRNVGWSAGTDWTKWSQLATTKAAYDDNDDTDIPWYERCGDECDVCGKVLIMASNLKTGLCTRCQAEYEALGVEMWPEEEEEDEHAQR